MPFNITYTNQDDKSEVHRSGWKYVYDHLLPLNNKDSPLLLDLYTDKTFNWKNSTIKLPYTKNWMGFCHHTFDTNFSDNNLTAMLDNNYFIESSKFCKGLIVLSNTLKNQMILELQKRKMDIQVHCLVHPTDLNVEQFDFNKFTNNKDKKLVHIGAWLRNIFFFYNLTLNSYDFSYKNIFNICPKKEKIQKVALKGTAMENYFYSDEFLGVLRTINPRASSRNIPICRGGNGIDNVFNKWYSQFSSYINIIKESVHILERLPNNEYDTLLTENIVFINLLDASAVNTLLECVARCTPIVVNKHPAVVELLGNDYPLYYNTEHQSGISTNYYLMNREIDLLLNKRNIIKNTNDYLKKLNKSNLDINYFKSQLVKLTQNN
jgi:hypothetical protein